MSEPLPAITPERKQGHEAFHNRGSPKAFTIQDFWRWSTSDLLSNTTRGVLAEFLVATDLGVAIGVRAEWDPYDLTTRDGITVEVKSAAYLQSWYQERHSSVSFGIRRTRAWDAGTNSYAEVRRRQAEVYVFCLLAHRDQATVDPLDVGQWRFWVLRTRVLDEVMGDQAGLSLSRLESVGAVEAAFGGIGRAIRSFFQ